MKNDSERGDGAKRGVFLARRDSASLSDAITCARTLYRRIVRGCNRGRREDVCVNDASTSSAFVSDDPMKTSSIFLDREREQKIFYSNYVTENRAEGNRKGPGAVVASLEREKWRVESWKERESVEER